MSFQTYQSFIDRFCEQAGLPDPQSMYQFAEFRIGGTDFLLRHGGKRAPGMVTVYCSLGSLPPAGQREAALLRLLETNLVLFGSGSNPCFASNPEKGTVLLTCALSLAEASPPGVLAMLVRFDALATEWRTTHFLDQDGGAEGAKRGTAAKGGRRGPPSHIAHILAAGQAV